MLNSILSSFYERDLRRLIEEIQLFQREEHLWQTKGSVKNTSGNLVLHLIGGLNYLIGAKLAHTSYIRHRDQEFTNRDVPRLELITQIEALIVMIRDTLSELGPEGMTANYPIPFDDQIVPNSYVLVQLLAHLNYHLGQINYLRRVLESQGEGK